LVIKIKANCGGIMVHTDWKRWSLAILFIVLVSFLQACGQEPQEKDQVRVVTLPFITFSPFYIALEEGYFEDQGLEVELVNMTVQEEILPALSSGQVDVSSGLLSAGMLNIIARGGDVKITADKGYVDPEGCINWAIIGRQELIESGDLESEEQLRGLTVNIVPSTWLEFYLSKVLETGGLTLDEITKTNVSAPATPDALDQGQIDVAVNSEPWVTRLMKTGHQPVLALPQEVIPNATAAVMVYGPTLLGENSDVGTRFMTAYLQAVRQYNEGKTTRNIDIVSKFTNLDQELLQEMCWPALQDDGDLNVQSVLDFQDWAIAAGYVESPVTEEDFWEDRFVMAANQALEKGQ
jgi:NitT/TauT family transport system substrate-binding protein